jgi:hypothetical protein
LGLSWIFISLRMFVNTFLTKRWRVDDLLLIVAIVSSHSYYSLLPTLFLLSNFSLDNLYHKLYGYGTWDKVRYWVTYLRYSN